MQGFIQDFFVRGEAQPNLIIKTSYLTPQKFFKTSKTVFKTYFDQSLYRSLTHFIL